MPARRPAFPHTLLEFQDRFGTEEACHAYLVECRWPDGFRCQKCGQDRSYARKDRRATECAGCGRLSSVTAGTVLHKSKVSLRAWLWAAWLLVSSKGGISALELSRQLGLSYETAFTMLHKLRRAMVAPDREPLRGRIEMDETYVGGPQSGPRGRGALGKTLVVGAVECRGKVPRRIRLRVIERADRATLHAFAREVVEPGSTLVTDGHQGYDELRGYRHRRQIVGQDGVTKEEVLPRFHMAIGNLKAWLTGTHHGAITARHLQAYLDEFAFRYNRRRNLGAAFQRLLGLVPQVGTLTYEALYAGTPKG